MIGNKWEKNGNRLITNRTLDKTFTDGPWATATFATANTNTAVADKVGNMFVAY